MTDLYAEALSTFAALLGEAKAAGTEVEPNAMTVATATAAGRPSARTVLLKAYDDKGFVFYTHTHSQKGRELHDNPHAALLFLWRSLREAGIQVRVEGAVTPVSDAEADAYFASRPRDSQIGAWASAQSRPVESRFALEAAVAKAAARHLVGAVPRPPYWSGFRIAPVSIEFWADRPFRLHDRLVYRRSAAADGTDAWATERLFP